MIWGCNMCGLKHFASNNSRCDGLLPRYQKLGLVHDSNNDFLEKALCRWTSICVEVLGSTSFLTKHCQLCINN